MVLNVHAYSCADVARFVIKPQYSCESIVFFFLNITLIKTSLSCLNVRDAEFIVLVDCQ